MLKFYVVELKAINPNSIFELCTIKIDNDEEVFDYLYVCSSAIKERFNRGCKKFIGVNGVFLIGAHEGQILTIFGVDANNDIYSLIYALIQVESKDT